MSWENAPLRRALLASAQPAATADATALSLAEQVALHLAKAILNDEIAPGERIQEQGVSERFHVSRGPVREALRMLENMGLVQILPRRGAIVTKLSVKEVADTFEIRAVLFGLAARHLAQSRSDHDLAVMRQRLATLQAIAGRDDPDAAVAYVTAVREFGLVIYSGSDNDRLIALLSSLLHQTLRYSRLGLSSPERRRQSAENWAALVAHIEQGRAALAETAARTLVEQSREEAIRLLSGPPAGEAAPDR